MRLSGTYTARLFFSILPLTVTATLIFYVFRNEIFGDFAGSFMGRFIFSGGLLATALLWLADMCYIRFRFGRLHTLKTDRSLVWNKEPIEPADIIRISPLKNQRTGRIFQVIEFELKDGRIFKVMDKPKTVVEDLLEKPSKTLKMLFRIYPTLASKLTEKRFRF